MEDIEIVDVLDRSYDLSITLCVDVRINPSLSVQAAVRVDPEWDTSGELVGVAIEPVKAISYQICDTEHDAFEPSVDPFTSILIRRSRAIEEYARAEYTGQAFAERMKEWIV